MPTIEQIRAARALLDWSQSDLADYADLSQTGIARIENGTNKPNTKTIDKINAAFAAADIEFLDETGVRKKTGEIKTLKGSEGFNFFLDDVYNTALKYGTTAKPCEVFLSNVVHENWTKWMGEEKWKNHTDRMAQNNGIMDVRIIVEEDDWNFPANNYSQYKWFPKEYFHDQSFYSYHDRLVFLNFTENNVIVTIMKNKEFAESYRNLFRIAWDNLASDPSKSSAISA